MITIVKIYNKTKFNILAVGVRKTLLSTDNAKSLFEFASHMMVGEP